jgi:RNase P subunit RPR2
MKSTCCDAECDLVSKHRIIIDNADADETGWRCLKCGHKFYVWTKAEVKNERTQEQKTGRDQGV